MRKEILALLHKDFTLELRESHSIAGIAIYVIATIFVAFLSFKKLDTAATWNALFWIIILFSAFNAVVKSFQQESSASRLYLYSLVNPKSVIVSKIIYNTLLLWALTFITLFFYILFIGNEPLENIEWTGWLCAILLGTSSISSILTLIAAIAAKTKNSGSMMAVLGLPIIIPTLLVSIEIAKASIGGLPLSESMNNIMILVAINAIVWALSFVLFPYLWRD